MSRSVSRFRLRYLTAVVMYSLIITQNSFGDEYELEIDSSQSVVTVMGRFNGIEAMPQDEAGMSGTTSLTGTITVDIDNLDNATRIEFTDGNVVSENNGDWLPAANPMDESGPGEPQPANIALMFDTFLGAGWGAIRDFQFSVESFGASISDGQFAPDAEFVAFAGNFDFYADVIGPPQLGREPLEGSVAVNVPQAMGQINVTPTELQVTLPVFLDSFTGVTLELAGQIVASIPLIQVVGDFDGDGMLSTSDIDMLSRAVRDGSPDAIWDLNADGSVGDADRLHWIRELAETELGDSNLDGTFNSTDLVAVFRFGEYEDDVPLNSTWESGDWDGSGDFDASDFVAAFAAGAYQATDARAVPEPLSFSTGWSIVLLCSLMMRRPVNPT